MEDECVGGALDAMREGIARDKGFSLCTEYTEEEAAGFVGMHKRTLAQARREGRIKFVRKSPRNIRYLGVNLVDFILASMTGGTDAQKGSEIRFQQPSVVVEDPVKPDSYAAAMRAFGGGSEG